MRIPLKLVLISLLAGTSAGDLAAQAGRPVDPQSSPAEVQDAVARGNLAIQELQKTLLGRLTAELATGGPAAAVRVCRDEAQQLTAAIGVKHGVAIGRTSHRLRNPANAPRAWAAAVVAAHAGRSRSTSAGVSASFGRSARSTSASPVMVRGRPSTLRSATC